VSRYTEYWESHAGVTVRETTYIVTGGGDITSVPRDGGKIVKNIFVTLLGKLGIDFEDGEE